MTARLSPKDRTKQLLAVAVRLAAAKGWTNLTREDIARAAGVSEALVTARLGTMHSTRRSVMRAALVERCVPVVAEGLALRDTTASKADHSLKELCAAWVKQ